MNSRLFAVIFLIYLTFQAFAQPKFGNPQFIPDDLSPRGQAIADFDGNNLNDIALLTETGAVIIFYNNGNYQFDTLHVQSADIAVQMDAADLNSDNKADLILLSGSYKSETNAIFLKSTGRQFDISKKKLANTFLGPMKVVDFDKDNKVDFIVSGVHGTIFMKGDGTGSFTSSPLNIQFGSDTQFEVADWNKDGLNDFLYSYTDHLEIRLQQANQAFSTIKINIPGPPVAFSQAVADFNGDGYPDFAFTAITPGQSQQFQLLLLKNDGVGNFLPPLSISPTKLPFWGLNHFDYNNDNKEDLVMGTSSGITLLKNDGSGQFTLEEITKILTEGAVYGVVTASIGNAEHEDIIEILPAKKMIINSWDQDHYAQNVTVILGVNAPEGSITDLDHDGFLDFVIGDASNNCIGISKGRGNFKFDPFTIIKTDGVPYILKVGDFNSDGWDDLVYCIRNDVTHEQKIEIRFSNSNGGFNNPQEVNIEASSFIQVADLNLDKHLDLISQTGLFYGDGTGAFIRADLAINIGSRWLIGNFNNDNFPDLAFLVTDGLYVSLNENGSFLSASKVILANPYSGTLETVNSNNDNLTDLLYQDLADRSSFTLFTNTGNGNFSSKRITVPGVLFFGGFDMADFNEDETVDIACGYTLSNSSTYGVAIFSKNSNGEFTIVNKANQDLILFPKGTHDITLARDVNQDNKLDIVTVSNNGLPVLIYPNITIQKPTQSAKEIEVENITENTATIKIIGGKNTGRLVTVRESAYPLSLPKDLKFSENVTWGPVTDLGNKNAVLYQGPDSTVQAKNLQSNTEYIVTSFEYNAYEDNSGFYFLTSEYVSSTFKTDFVTETTDITTNLALFPNPTSSIVSIKMDNPGSVQKLELFNMQGQYFHSFWNATAEMISFPTDKLNTGQYIIKLYTERTSIVLKFVKQ